MTPTYVLMGALVERMRYTNHEKLDIDDDDGDDFDVSGSALGLGVGVGLGLGFERLSDRNTLDSLTIIWDCGWVCKLLPCSG